MDAKPALSPLGSIAELPRDLAFLTVRTTPLRRDEPTDTPPRDRSVEPEALPQVFSLYTRLPEQVVSRTAREDVQDIDAGAPADSLDVRDPNLPSALDLVEKTRLAFLLNHQSKYPAAPALIRRAWNGLVPAIVELSYHQDQDALTLTRTVRRARKLPPLAHKAPFLHDGTTLDAWLLDVLVLLGTIPVEGPDATDRFTQAGAQRLRRRGQASDDGGLSAPGRNEALMCLELLCAKAWYARNREDKNHLQTQAALYAALQFMYWECGLPPRLPHLLDAPPDVLEPFYQDVRTVNYRQLYAIDRAGLLPELLIRIHRGITALHERREHYHARYRRTLRKDARWTRDFTQHTPIIAAKYAVLEDGRWSVPQSDTATDDPAADDNFDDSTSTPAAD